MKQGTFKTKKSKWLILVKQLIIIDFEFSQNVT